MKQEDKDLLLRYLSMALPYGVIVDYKQNEHDNHQYKIRSIHPTNYSGWIGYVHIVGCGSEAESLPFKIGQYKPYLRPLSSMTEEEDEQRIQLGICRSPQTNGHEVTGIKPGISESYNSQAFQNALDFLLGEHFDIFGLIPKGLAIAVTKENNPYDKMEE